MTKVFGTIVALWVIGAVLVLGGLVTSADAQEAPDPAYAALEARVSALEAGQEQDLLKTACWISATKALREGLTVQWCRRYAPDVVEGDKALVTVVIRLGDGYGKFITRTSFFKSSWSVENWGAEPLSG